MSAPAGIPATDPRPGVSELVAPNVYAARNPNAPPRWYLRAVARNAAAVDRWPVESPTVAEILPGLYRSVLDTVAALEAEGLRREAASMREEAIRAYSGAWDRAAERRLRRLIARAARIAAGRARRRRREVVDALEKRVDLGRTSV